MTQMPDAPAQPEIVCRRAEPEDFPALEQLLEFYQYDLSDIWHQELDASGRYGYDLTRHRRGDRSHAHLAFAGSQPIGLALVAPACVTRNEGLWMEQFFVHQRFRRAGVGDRLARHVFSSHPGLWEVGQIPGNAAAYAFWRRVIGDVTQGRFTEVQVTEGWWRGVVQQFSVTGAEGLPA